MVVPILRFTKVSCGCFGRAHASVNVVVVVAAVIVVFVF